MADPRRLLALGCFSAEERSRLSGIAADAALELRIESEPGDASAFLASSEPMAAFLLRVDAATAESFTIERRAEPHHAFVPVFSWSDTVSDLGFAEAFASGADDLVDASRDMALRIRLRQIPKQMHSLPEATRGRVLVADPDRVRRVVIGRVLRNAGYSVTFASTEEDAKAAFLDSPLSLVVCTCCLMKELRATIVASQEGGDGPMWIVSSPPRNLRECRDRLEGLARVTTTDAFAPAENILFVSNEMSRPCDVDKRATPRLLYGTTVAFRGRGREQDDFGYTYNISEGGLYVRTLAPPDDELVWLELCPPRADRRVRLVGKVAWRRGLGSSQYATVPAGFGVELVDGARMDREAWTEGYRAFRGLVG